MIKIIFHYQKRILLIDSRFDFSNVGFLVVHQPAITCLMLTIETLEQVVKYVQS